MITKKLMNELETRNYTDLFEIRCPGNGGFEETGDESRFLFRSEKLELVSETRVNDDDVYSRTDTVGNISEEPVTITRAKSKFVLPDGDYEVYTQFNNWLHESTGGWQPLVTGVYSKVGSVRTTLDAAPVIAIWNNQNGRGIVFHLPAVFSWEMSVRRRDLGGGKGQVEVVVGPDADNFSLNLAPGEKAEISRIIYFGFRNKVDLDCWKLHRYINDIYPRRTMPVIYNTWLSNFDSFTYDSLHEQAVIASRIGAEYFVVDAGWFADAMNWWNRVGDWEENRNGSFVGRMKEFTDMIHSLGMKFGLWFEIERATDASEAVRLHKDCYIEYGRQYFVNFAKSEAREYILNLLNDRIKRYRIDFIKFDFNADIFDDPYGDAFISYYRGYEKFIKDLRSAHPDIYLENCASGGMRMQMANGFLFDSFWLSDNQSAFDGIRIFKDTMLRMPPQWIEKWATIRSLPGFSPVYGGDKKDKLLTTCDGVWENVASLAYSWIDGFLSAGPLGISCDLTKLTDEVLDRLAKHISEYKRDREFFIGADCRIITGANDITSFEYCNRDMSVIKILTFVRNPMQHAIVVYPAVDTAKNYSIGGQTVSGAEIDRFGIRLEIQESFGSIRTDIDKA